MNAGPSCKISPIYRWVIGSVCILVIAHMLSVREIHVTHALDDGLARTPPMGWNSWNKFGCNINETLIKQMADAMVSSGMLAAGYQYLNLDDCWEGSRDSNGYIQPNATRFPSGMKALADYVHSKGLKFGLYSSIGRYTCATYAGSRGYEAKDAQQYAAWGVDYLKMDDCYMDDVWSPDFDRIVVNGTSYEAEAGVRTGQADIQNCTGCSGGQKVGYVGNGVGTLTFNTVSVPAAGQYALTIYYSDGSTDQEQKSIGLRTAYVNVNGVDSADRLVFTPTGNWATPGPVTVQVTLRAGINQIKLHQPKSLRDIYIERYSIMRDALAATGRPIVYSLCNQGALAPWEWSAPLGHLWRTTEDIKDSWSSVMEILDINSAHARYARPGAWNDPDMLEVGNGGMTDTEYRAHFSLWALMAAPLIAGNDLSTMSASIKSILTNAEVIAINQDSLGSQGTKVWESGSLSVWSKPLSDPLARAVILFNRGAGAADITARWSDIGLAAGDAAIRNLWTHTDVGTFRDSYTANVPSHGVVMLKVRSAIATATPTLTLTGTATFTPSPSPTGSLTPTPTNSPTPFVSPPLTPTITPTPPTYFEGPFEQEPNNTANAANGPIRLGTSYLGLPNDADDYYRFEVTTPMQVKVGLTDHPAQDTSNLQLQLRTSNDTLIGSAISKPFMVTSTLPIGSYYARVFFANGPYASNQTYQLQVDKLAPSTQFLPLSYRSYFPYYPYSFEIEPNNSIAEANGPIKFNNIYTGLPNDETDRFWFYVPQAGTLQLSLTNHVAEATTNLQLQLRDTSNNLEPLAFAFKKPFAVTKTVPPGIYYARIFYANGPYDLTQPYSLEVILTN